MLKWLLLSLLLTADPVDPLDALAPNIADTRVFATSEGEKLWRGYGKAPFGFLLVTKARETLLCQPAPQGFTSAGTDAATGCGVAHRPPSGLPDGLLAAMPVFGPPSTIVMGTPEATGRSLANWQRTILHEHFHQYQSALPGYYARVAALDLSGGDETGMWMLNYAFPYADAHVGRAYAAASNKLADALAARGAPGFTAAVERFLTARRDFAASVGQRDWRYLEFQLWQEGVARWTDIALGLRHPDSELRADAAASERRTIESLRKPDLATQGRELAYTYGAGEAMLLEAIGPEWRRRYPRVLALGPLFNPQP
jgi:hypothetical protein